MFRTVCLLTKSVSGAVGWIKKKWLLSPCPPLISSKHPAAELDDLAGHTAEVYTHLDAPHPQPFSLPRSVSLSFRTGTAEPDYLREHTSLISSLAHQLAARPPRHD